MIAALAVLLTACGGSSGGTKSSSGSKVLRLAFAADMDPPDPDTNYQLQGNQVTTSLYEGLLDYAPDSTSKIVPLLAEKYDVSADGLTYTFTLRSGLKFSDGTPLDSTALKAGFDRRVAEAVKSPMSYMLANVAGYQNPDAATFVITLKTPVSAFPTYLASPFSPKAVNPTVLEAHKDDNAVEFLKTHSAGTGPYEISSWTAGQEYVLTRNPNYWGAAPYYDEVDVKIISDLSTQLVQLQGGDLDIISGQPIATVKSLEGNKDVQIVKFPVLQKAWLHVNLVASPTSDPAFREALRDAIDRPKLVDQVWGDYAAESTQMYPVSNVPAGKAADDWTYDPSKLQALSSGKTVTLGYSTSVPGDAQVVGALQAQWQQAGLKVELVPVQSGDQYTWSKDLASAPDLFYEVAYPDSTHPDTWSRLFWYSDVAGGAGGFLNYLVDGTKDADAAMDAGLAAIDQSAIDDAYGTSGDLVHDQVGLITLADPADVFLVRTGISGFAHWIPTPLTLELKALKGS